MFEKITERGYRALRLLGRGAFSEVYLLEDEGGRLYACKVSAGLQMLEREARILKKLHHPLFPACFDMWQEEGRGMLVMEYVPGGNLETFVRRRGSFSSEQTARIGMELAGGLAYLHERRRPLIFRDVKPANVMVGQDGRVRLLDLGCVCHAGESAGIAGTPGFGAPEQMKAGARPGIPGDVYGLGRTLEAAAGAKCGKRLRRVLERCTEEPPEKRPPDMRCVMELLASCCGAACGRPDGLQRAVLRGELFVQKNIWEYGH